jgi:hypothetical protein
LALSTNLFLFLFISGYIDILLDAEPSALYNVYVTSGELGIENGAKRRKTGLFGPSGRNKREKSMKFYYFFCKTKPI